MRLIKHKINKVKQTPYDMFVDSMTSLICVYNWSFCMIIIILIYSWPLCLRMQKLVYFVLTYLYFALMHCFSTLSHKRCKPFWKKIISLMFHFSSLHISFDANEPCWCHLTRPVLILIKVISYVLSFLATSKVV